MKFFSCFSIGINAKLNDQFQEATVKKTQEGVNSANLGFGKGMTSTGSDNRENDHDYGYVPGRNGHNHKGLNTSLDSSFTAL